LKDRDGKPRALLRTLEKNSDKGSGPILGVFFDRHLARRWDMKSLNAIRLAFFLIALSFLLWAAAVVAVSGAVTDPYAQTEGTQSSRPGLDVVVVAQSDPDDDGVQALVMQIEGNKVTVRTNKGTGKSTTLEVRNAASFKVGELVRLKGNTILKTTAAPETAPRNQSVRDSGNQIKPKTPPTATPMPLPDPKGAPALGKSRP